VNFLSLAADIRFHLFRERLSKKGDHRDYRINTERESKQTKTSKRDCLGL
jgi:hypothetical protein